MLGHQSDHLEMLRKFKGMQIFLNSVIHQKSMALPSFMQTAVSTGVSHLTLNSSILLHSAPSTPPPAPSTSGPPSSNGSRAERVRARQRATYRALIRAS